MILVYSGGLDSTVLLYAYKAEIKACLSFDYGSRHNERESDCAAENCRRLGIPRHVVELPFIGDLFKSSILKGGEAVPHGHYTEESMKSTVVPFRNGIMLAIAAGYAESVGAKRIAIANHAGDHAIYPDCRPEFIDSMRDAIQMGTWESVYIFAPFTDKTKREIACMGKGAGVDYSLTYSCYEGGQTHCGECGTCVERKEALVGFDPTSYRR